MGGPGSGSGYRWNARSTAESCHAIDVRRWKRDGCLEPGRWFSWKWTRDGEEPGAEFRAEGRSTYFTVSGTGRVEDQAFRPLTTLFLDWAESTRLLAETTAEILHIGLPDLRAIMAGSGVEAVASAAE